MHPKRDLAMLLTAAALALPAPATAGPTPVAAPDPPAEVELALEARGAERPGIAMGFAGEGDLAAAEPVRPPATAVAAPEPGTAALVGFGLLGLVWCGRRR